MLEAGGNSRSLGDPCPCPACPVLMPQLARAVGLPPCLLAGETAGSSLGPIRGSLLWLGSLAGPLGMRSEAGAQIWGGGGRAGQARIPLGRGRNQKWWEHGGRAGKSLTGCIWSAVTLVPFLSPSQTELAPQPEEDPGKKIPCPPPSLDWQEPCSPEAQLGRPRDF